MAAGLGANVTILDVNLDWLRYLDDVMPKNVDDFVAGDRRKTSSAWSRGRAYADQGLADPGGEAPRLVPRDDLRRGCRRAGAVIIDVAMDQGGGVETSRPTTHDAAGVHRG